MTRAREPLDAPELGASVELVECTVGDLLPLIDLAQTGSNLQLTFAVLAATLHVNGQRVSEEQLRALPAHMFRVMMTQWGPRALAMCKMRQEEPSDEEKA